MAYGDLFKTATGAIVIETAKNKFVVIKAPTRANVEGERMDTRDPSWIALDELPPLDLKEAMEEGDYVEDSAGNVWIRDNNMLMQVHISGRPYLNSWYAYDIGQCVAMPFAERMLGPFKKVNITWEEA